MKTKPKLTEVEYKEYTRCWMVYLETLSISSSSRRFREVLQNHVRPGYTMVKYPMVWPEAEYIFVDVHNFIKAVQEAEKCL